jgi:hypothetical protein
LVKLGNGMTVCRASRSARIASRNSLNAKYLAIALPGNADFLENNSFLWKKRLDFAGRHIILVASQQAAHSPRIGVAPAASTKMRES